MNFYSDTVAEVSPAIMEAVAQANRGSAIPYGSDPWSSQAQDLFRQVFETELEVVPVVSGTAANALALGAAAPPFGAIYCHPESHVNQLQCGAPEHFTGGAKLVPVPCEGTLLEPEALDLHLRRALGDVHQSRPAAINITQPTDHGTVYGPEQVQELAAVARSHGLLVQMDGARFANAVATLGCSPAEVTWKAGVDLLAFGATKNGAMGAEAVLAFRGDLGEELAYRRKRAGHLLAKMRFVSAQLVAYLEEDLWLRNAAHANAAATRLASGLEAVPGLRRVHPVEVNMVWAAMPEAMAKALAEAGFGFHARDHGDGKLARLVTAWNTPEAEVDALIQAAKKLAT